MSSARDRKVMSDLTDLYQELILDHGKRPRNHRAIDQPTHRAEGFNPLCGDRVEVFLDVHDGQINDISFIGSGCAICTASASMMTETIKGEQSTDAIDQLNRFQGLLTGESGGTDNEDFGILAALAGVRQYPMRVKCATLPWHTMKAALRSPGASVSTE